MNLRKRQYVKLFLKYDKLLTHFGYDYPNLGQKFIKCADAWAVIRLRAEQKYRESR